MILYYLFLSFFVLLCLILSLLVLVQESKTMGLGASFGGDTTTSFFGASTALVFKKITAYLLGIFIVSCIVLSFWTARLPSSVHKEQKSSLIFEE